MRGRIIPAMNIRKRFRLPEREIDLDNCFIIANTSRRTVALVVDSVSDVVHYSQKGVIKADEILPDMEYVEGVVKLEGDIILIHNLDQFLSFAEERILDKALDVRD